MGRGVKIQRSLYLANRYLGCGLACILQLPDSLPLDHYAWEKDINSVVDQELLIVIEIAGRRGKEKGKPYTRRSQDFGVHWQSSRMWKSSSIVPTT